MPPLEQGTSGRRLSHRQHYARRAKRASYGRSPIPAVAGPAPGCVTSYSSNPVVVELCEAVEAFGDSVDPEFVVEFQEGTIAQPVAEGFVDMVVSESLKLPAPVWRASFAGLLEVDRSVELERIAAPTLVVWGDQDVVAPRADQDALAEGVPGAELLVYEVPATRCTGKSPSASPPT